MNNDLLGRIPGGDRMVGGFIALAFGIFMFQTLKYQSLIFVRMPFALVGAYGVFQFFRGLIEWKYSNTKLNEILNPYQYLFIDIPFYGDDLTGLYKLEDSLIEFLRTRKTITMEGHVIDRPNKVGTICLKGRQADAIFANIFVVLSSHSSTGQIDIFPKTGDPIDTESRGKRVLMHVKHAHSFHRH